MRWPRRNIAMAVSAAAAIGLAASLVAVLLPRSDTSGKPPPTGSRQLYSPFTGEPVAAFGPVLEAGVRPPYAESTGTGTGVVLRDGHAYAIRWSRPDADGGTTFTTASGQAMTFARGPVWVVLTATP